MSGKEPRRQVVIKPRERLNNLCAQHVNAQFEYLNQMNSTYYPQIENLKHYKERVNRQIKEMKLGFDEIFKEVAHKWKTEKIEAAKQIVKRKQAEIKSETVAKRQKSDI